jgi:NAD(P)H-dependent flavin oxidoreductase YrpB (nitropropane dioxygenase family)
MGGGVGGPDLAAAVRDAGGLGMVPAGDPLPSGCGVNFLGPYIESLEDVADAAAASEIIEFFSAPPNPAFVACGHDAQAIVGWQVGSVKEAVAAEVAGCDYVIVQGIEAGGHVRGYQLLDVLLPRALARVSIPVVAAGGVATPERVAQLLSMGADAVRVGTRFLACSEARTHPEYLANLLEATSADTVVTKWFDDNSGWPNAPHRVLRGSLAAARRSGWRGTKPPTRDDTRPVADMAQYAGVGVGALTTIEPAETVLRHLVSQLAP